MNILFICSRNKWRSRTAETIFKNHPVHQIKSAGTTSSARVRVNQSLIDWAEVIYVMEDKHEAQLVERFPNLRKGKEIIVLDIPYDYQYMDEELIEILKSSISWL